MKIDPNDPEQLRELFEKTEISKTPLSGIVKGYHRLPYILVGPNEWEERGSVELRGEIRVSPRLLFSMNPQTDNYEQIFSEHEPIMDQRIMARHFTFNYARPQRNKPLKIEGDTFSFVPHEDTDDKVLSRILDSLMQQENIHTGVIWCPNPKFYPISLERFIFSILDKEFGN